MATYYADTAKDASPRSDTGTVTVPFQFNTGESAFGANGNIFVLAKVPRFATVTDLFVDLPILDSANTGRMGLGTSANATLFVESINTGAAIRASSTDAAATANTHIRIATIPYRVLNTTAGGQTVDEDIRLTTSNALTTVIANAVVKGFVRYNCLEPEASHETRPTS